MLRRKFRTEFSIFNEILFFSCFSQYHALTFSDMGNFTVPVEKSIKVYRFQSKLSSASFFFFINAFVVLLLEEILLSHDQMTKMAQMRNEWNYPWFIYENIACSQLTIAKHEIKLKSQWAWKHDYILDILNKFHGH